jgi:hypothetical protein
MSIISATMRWLREEQAQGPRTLNAPTAAQQIAAGTDGDDPDDWASGGYDAKKAADTFADAQVQYAKFYFTTS